MSRSADLMGPRPPRHPISLTSSSSESGLLPTLCLGQIDFFFLFGWWGVVDHSPQMNPKLPPKWSEAGSATTEPGVKSTTFLESPLLEEMSFWKLLGSYVTFIHKSSFLCVRVALIKNILLLLFYYRSGVHHGKVEPYSQPLKPPTMEISILNILVYNLPNLCVCARVHLSVCTSTHVLIFSV